MMSVDVTEQGQILSYYVLAMDFDKTFHEFSRPLLVPGTPDQDIDVCIGSMLTLVSLDLITASFVKKLCSGYLDRLYQIAEKKGIII